MGQFCSYEHVHNALKIVLSDRFKNTCSATDENHQKIIAELIDEVMDEIAAQKENSFGAI